MTLSDFFAAHPKAALAYSGGTDSAYLLYAALKAGRIYAPIISALSFSRILNGRTRSALGRSWVRSRS